MLGKAFMNAVANGEIDILQMLLDILAQSNVDYCVVGGLAVNAYVEPVVSLDLDLVVATKDTATVCRSAEQKGLEVERFEHSINLGSSKSDLRIQLQKDVRYQDFIARAVEKDVLGYTMNVASVEDVLQGKVWAYTAAQRRRSKRQKDLADILRLVEADPSLESRLPDSIRDNLG